LITEKQLQTLKLHANPWTHRAVIKLVHLDFQFPQKTHITLENRHRIPKDRAVIFAMNHPDRYNYIPFMYQLVRLNYPAVAPWVKGKYYENFLMAKFLDWTNNIPIPSRGYIITKDFQLTMHRRPNKTEYRQLRNLVDGRITLDNLLAQANEAIKQFVTTPHADFDPQAQPYDKYIETKYNHFMRIVTRHSIDALLNKTINLLIFPQGTRSLRLLPGHPGIAQIALKTGAPVIPIGCNGSDKLYPSSSPFSSGGHIVYRIGEPLTVDGALAPFAISEPFEPFTKKAELKFGSRFQAATDFIMEHINELLNPEYQFAPNATPVADDSAKRFV